MQLGSQFPRILLAWLRHGATLLFIVPVSLALDLPLANAESCDRFNAPSTLFASECEAQCNLNQCESFMANSDKDYSCKTLCSGEPSALIEGIDILYSCGKGMTWDLGKSIFDGILAGASSAYETGAENSRFLEACNNDIEIIDGKKTYPCKRKLAKEAAVFVNEEQLAKLNTFILTRKRDDVRHLAARDPAYRKRLLALGVPLPENNRPGIELITEMAKRELSSINTRWQCYSAPQRTEMICEVAAAIVLPIAKLKLLSRIGAIAARTATSSAASAPAALTATEVTSDTVAPAKILVTPVQRGSVLVEDMQFRDPLTGKIKYQRRPPPARSRPTDQPGSSVRLIEEPIAPAP